MRNIQNYYFFRCYHCGEWFYTNKIIKTKKCWKCNRSFQFNNSIKFTRSCSINNAIAIIKELKKRVEKETLTKYINKETNQLT